MCRKAASARKSNRRKHLESQRAGGPHEKVSQSHTEFVQQQPTCTRRNTTRAPSIQQQKTGLLLCCGLGSKLWWDKASYPNDYSRHLNRKDKKSLRQRPCLLRKHVRLHPGNVSETPQLRVNFIQDTQKATSQQPLQMRKYRPDEEGHILLVSKHPLGGSSLAVKIGRLEPIDISAVIVFDFSWTAFQFSHSLIT